MKRFLLGIFVIIAMVLTACNKSKSTENVDAIAPVPAEFAGRTNPLGTDAAQVGADIFDGYCASCHGESGHGDGPAAASLEPAPKNLAELQTQVGDDYLFWRISTGKPGTSMIAWQGILTDEQIWQAAAFIRTLK